MKPENIVLGDYGEAIVLDWGLAKQIGSADEETAPVVLTEDAQPQATRQGATPGTPAYMSPEQAAGRVDLIDHRTDIYGLGTILFEILTGHAPHRAAEDDAASVGREVPRFSLPELLKRICDADTPLARATDPRIPRALDAVCAKAMSKRRDDRYSDAKKLVDEIRRFLSNEPVSVWREPWTGRVKRWSRRPLVSDRIWTTALALFLLSSTAIIRGVSYWYDAISNAKVKDIINRSEHLKTEGDRLRQNLIAHTRSDRDLAHTLETAGDENLKSGRGTEALKLYLTALEFRQKLAAAAKPGDAPAQLDLMISHYKLGELMQQRFLFNLSSEHFRCALDALATAPQISPFGKVSAELERLIQLCEQSASTVLDVNFATAQDAEAVPALLLTRVKALLTYAESATDDIPAAVREKWSTGNLQAELLEQATLTADKLRILEPTTSDNLYNAGHCFGLCMKSLAKLEIPEKDLLMAKIQMSAIDCLKAAFAAGFNDAERISKDSDLEALRELSEFQMLLKQLEQN